MNINIKAVQANSLAPLFILDKTLEPTPEPFRLQSNVLLTINFNEYMRFITVYLDHMDFLQTPTSTLKQYVMQGKDIELKRAFFKDMCFAICKELYYAETANKDATRMLHQLDDADQYYSSTDLQDLFNQSNSLTVDAIRKILTASNFSLPTSFRKSNAPLWVYANLLYLHATSPICLWNTDSAFLL